MKSLKCLNKLRARHSGQVGAALAEYIMLALVVGAGVGVSVLSLGSALSTKYVMFALPVSGDCMGITVSDPVPGDPSGDLPSGGGPMLGGEGEDPGKPFECGLENMPPELAPPSL